MDTRRDAIVSSVTFFKMLEPNEKKTVKHTPSIYLIVKFQKHKHMSVLQKDAKDV